VLLIMTPVAYHWVVGGLYGEPGACGGGGDEFDDGADVGEGTASPVYGDEGEQAVRDLG